MLHNNSVMFLKSQITYLKKKKENHTAKKTSSQCQNRSPLLERTASSLFSFLGVYFLSTTCLLLWNKFQNEEHYVHEESAGQLVLVADTRDTETHRLRQVWQYSLLAKAVVKITWQQRSQWTDCGNRNWLQAKKEKKKRLPLALIQTLTKIDYNQAHTWDCED